MKKQQDIGLGRDKQQGFGFRVVEAEERQTFGLRGRSRFLMYGYEGREAAGRQALQAQAVHETDSSP